MKHIVWAGIFIGYLLALVGILILLGTVTRGIKVEGQVEITVHGTPVMVEQMVEFNDLPIVRMTIGKLGLLIAMGVPYIIATSLIRAWDNVNEKMSRGERVICVGTFLAFFFAFSFILDVHTIFEIWEIPGLVFMLITCAGSLSVSKFLCNLPGLKYKFTNLSDGEGRTV